MGLRQGQGEAVVGLAAALPCSPAFSLGVFVTISEGTVVSLAMAGVCTLPNVSLVCGLQRSDT